MRTYYVYILANASRILYTGMTNDLERRVAEHKSRAVPGFTATYNVTKLVYYEAGPDVNAAIEREKQIKRWRREKRVRLIESINPGWRDLSLEWEG
ncbi:MAG: GIY-YIG nuclease family protein [Candidatus Methylomirabilis sp.]|nr:GIY-YIG nuclease family protein [Deltaproteobacteria bacterium]